MKCAIVYHYLASYRQPIFMELMKSTNIEFTLYSGKNSEINIHKINIELANKKISDGGLRWEFLKNTWIFNKKFLWQSGLVNLSVFGKYDSYIFLGSPYHLSTWFAVIIVRLRGKKAYYWMHGVYKDKPRVHDFLKLKLFYKLPNGFFLYGNRSLSILRKYNVKPYNNMHVIYNSLNYVVSAERRSLVSEISIFNFRVKYFKTALEPVVVFIGRVNSIKRIDMLIDAQSALENSIDKVKFNILIIGDGEERTKLERQITKLGLQDHVYFFGEVYDEKIISEILMYSDVCVNPGEVGLTAIHALSYGTPVISHDNLNIQMPEVEAIIPGLTGDLYGYGNVQNLAESINKWLLLNPIKTHEVMKACFSVIDNYYNPNYQRKIIEKVLNNKF